MKKSLIRIRDTVRQRLIDGSPPDAVKQWRDKEVAKLLQTRKETFKTRITGCDRAIQDIASLFSPEATDDSAQLAHHLRISDTWSMFPSNRLAKVDLKTVAQADLPAFAAVCRKRGMNDLADSVFAMHEANRERWRTNPQVKELQNIRSQLVILSADDPDSFFIGDIDTPPSRYDFATIQAGKIIFKDGNEVIEV